MPINNAINTSIPFSIADGGTAATSLTDHGVLVGSGVAAITSLVVGSTGTIMGGVTGSDPAFGTSADGDFTFTSSTASVDRALTISNTDNTVAATSAANLQITVGGGNVDDPRTTYTVTGAQSYTVGVDNDASDSFKIAASTALGTTDTFVMTSAGERTMPLQPAFLAVVASDDNNVTGGGAVYTLGTNVAYTEIFDQGSDFVTSGTFTAPVTGRYRLKAYIRINLITSSMTSGVTTIDTSNRTYNTYSNPAAHPTEPAFSATLVASTLADMDASDTAVVKIQVSGGSNTLDLDATNGGISDPAIVFCGYLQT